MSNVVSLGDYRKKVVKVDTVDTNLDDKIARIRESAKRINKLMEELRSARDAK